MSRILNIRKYNSLNEDLIREYNLHRGSGAKELICYVPFRMMYFAFNGEVIACCHNRSHILGVYPKQSIKKIWFGSKIKKLRKYIKNNDLDYGCYVCKDQIMSKNFAAAKSKMYDHYPIPKNKYPSVMEFELDNTCNLECIMCTGLFCSLIRKNLENKELVKSPYDSKFVNQLTKFIPYLEEAKFYGGEPFLIKIYYDIWEKMIEINPSIKFMIQTNGTVLNDKIKNILNKGFFNINISIDSVNKENYELIRKNADFDRVMENIKYFHEYCKDRNTFFSIIPTPIRQNWQDLPGLINFCNNLQVPVYFNTLIYPYKNALWNLAPEKLTEIYDYLSKTQLPENTENEKQNKIVFTDFLNQIIAWKNENIIKFKDKDKNLIALNEKLNEAKNIFISNLNIRLSKDLKNNKEKVSQKLNFYENLVNSKVNNLLPVEFQYIIYFELNKLKMDDMLKVLENNKFDNIIENTMSTFQELENNNYYL